MSRFDVRLRRRGVVLLSTLLMALSGLDAQTFDLSGLDDDEGGKSGDAVSQLFEDLSGPGEWRPFKLSLVWGVGMHELFAYEDARTEVRKWYETHLSNLSPNELEFQLNQMESNNLFYLNNSENYMGKHRGIRFHWQAESTLPVGLFAGVHLTPVQWQGSGTSSEGETVDMHSTRALFQPLVDDFVYLRELYNYYIPEPIEMATSFRVPQVEVGVSKNLGDWVQIGASALFAPTATSAIRTWHEDMTNALDNPSFVLNPGADLNVPLTYCGSISARFGMVSLGLVQFIQPAPAPVTDGGETLPPLQYGALTLGYGF